MKTYILTGIRILVALILLQTLYYKFTAHPDSVYIFDAVGLGATGRIALGVVELIAGILLLIPKYAWLGALMALGVISGALISHFTILGTEVNGDGGLLFYLALTVFIGSLITLIAYRKHIPYQNY
jgi:putative oxidoreductase